MNIIAKEFKILGRRISTYKQYVKEDTIDYNNTKIQFDQLEEEYNTNNRPGVYWVKSRKNKWFKFTQKGLKIIRARNYLITRLNRLEKRIGYYTKEIDDLEKIRRVPLG